MRRGVVLVVLVMMGIAVVWVWPAFSGPSPRDCESGIWGFNLLSRSWGCGDNWLVRFGDYGVNGL